VQAMVQVNAQDLLLAQDECLSLCDIDAPSCRLVPGNGIYQCDCLDGFYQDGSDCKQKPLEAGESKMKLKGSYSAYISKEKEITKKDIQLITENKLSTRSLRSYENVLEDSSH